MKINKMKIDNINEVKIFYHNEVFPVTNLMIYSIPLKAVLSENSN